MRNKCLLLSTFCTFQTPLTLLTNSAMMGKIQNKIQSGHQAQSLCKVCGKEGSTTAIRNHIEANHLEGLSIPCDRCDRAFGSRVALGMHIGRSHK